MTGGSGALGRHFVASCKRGVQAFTLGRSHRSDCLTNYLVEDLNSHLNGADAVVHLASLRPSNRSPEKKYSRNISLTKALCEASVQSGVKTLVFASSSSVYEGLPGPWKECAEPISPGEYGLSKWLSEQVCQRYGQRYGIKVVILRIAPVLGWPGDVNSSALMKLLHCVFQQQVVRVQGEGWPQRDYVCIEDVSRAFHQATKKSVPAGIYNIGGEELWSFKKLALWVQKKAPFPIHLEYYPAVNPGLARDAFMSKDNSKKYLGWSGEHLVSEALVKILAAHSPGSLSENRSRSEGKPF